MDGLFRPPPNISEKKEKDKEKEKENEKKGGRNSEGKERPMRSMSGISPKGTVQKGGKTPGGLLLLALCVRFFFCFFYFFIYFLLLFYFLFFSYFFSFFSSLCGYLFIV